LDVGEKHGGGIAVPRLDGLDTEPPIVAINIEEYLGSFPNPSYSFEGVPTPKKRKVGDRIEFKEVRAGNEKEIADHKVGSPGL